MIITISAVNLTERLSLPHHNHNGQSSKSPWGKDSAPQRRSWESRSARGPAQAPHPTNSPPELLLHLNLIDNISAQKKHICIDDFSAETLPSMTGAPSRILMPATCETAALLYLHQDFWDSLANSPAVGTIVEHVHHDWHPLSVTSQFNHFLEERSATI